MIKRYDSHLIPIASKYPTLNTDYSVPSGDPYIRPMKLTYVLSNTYYTFNFNTYEVHMRFYDPNSFYLQHFTTPHVITKTYTLRWAWAYISIDYNFRTSDEAYIHMFLNSSYAINKYPEKYSQIYTKYPEYFI